MTLEYELPQSTEIITAYLRVADLADRRCQQMLRRRDASAAMWGRASKHFFDLATHLANDDAWEASLLEGIERLRHDHQLTDWTLAVLELCLSRLSGVQRVCYELVECGPVDVKEVAAALGISPSQARQHTTRARRVMTNVRSSIAHLIPPKRLWYLQRKIS